MNKQLGVIFMLVCCAFAAPQRKNGSGGGGDESSATVVKQDQQLNPDGSYSFIYETSNGIKAAVSSSDGIAATGEFSYTAPEGEKIQLNYVANEGGFQPQGAHLPVEPPVPDHVIKSLEEIRANPPKDPDFNAAFLESVIARLKSLQG
ncbi:endocuticle structural glycoprotein ABD-4-like [Toxorhynchites rutilus septentrionalis]|uniref:endocuticle structural glycoprotein ABD-4-like n=1 Tax=Toxorhynchites rutilus septentrionalis TaxID=329112 RepID=UPI00247AAC7E|nr:endocuticle structural glycoprotein ABD-4-like [Toxorhynchites rutilus septentrionalis]